MWRDHPGLGAQGVEIDLITNFSREIEEGCWHLGVDGDKIWRSLGCGAGVLRIGPLALFSGIGATRRLRLWRQNLRFMGLESTKVGNFQSKIHLELQYSIRASILSGYFDSTTDEEKLISPRFSLCLNIIALNDEMIFVQDYPIFTGSLI